MPQPVRGAGRGYQNGGTPFATLSPRLSLFSDHLRTVLAVKGSLRGAQQRRALDGSGRFRTTLLRRGKGSLRTAPLAGDRFAAILVPFFAATDTAARVFRIFVGGIYTATLSLIPSFGACTRSCFVPRYRSVVCTEACPGSSWICSNSPPAARHNFAQVRRQSCRAGVLRQPTRTAGATARRPSRSGRHPGLGRRGLRVGIRIRLQSRPHRRGLYYFGGSPVSPRLSYLSSSENRTLMTARRGT